MATETDLKYYYSGGASNTDPDASLGGIKSTTEVPNGGLNNLFDDISLSEAVSGDVEYRCLFFTNTSSDTIYNVKTWIHMDTLSIDTDLALALDPNGATPYTVAGTGIPDESGLVFNGALMSYGYANEFQYSANMDTSPWTASAVTFSTNRTDPANTYNGIGLIGTAVSSMHYVYQDVTVFSNSNQTMSVFATPVVQTWCYLQMNVGSNMWAYFDLDNRVVGSAGSDIVNYGFAGNVYENNCHRVYINAADIGASTTLRGIFASAESDGDNIYIGDGTSTYVSFYGARIETETAYPTAFVRSEAAAQAGPQAYIRYLGNDGNISYSGGSVSFEICLLGDVLPIDSSKTFRMAGGVSGVEIEFYIDKDTGYGTFRTDTDIAGVRWTSGTKNLYDGRGHHVRISWASTTYLDLYIDGVLLQHLDMGQGVAFDFGYMSLFQGHRDYFLRNLRSYDIDGVLLLSALDGHSGPLAMPESITINSLTQAPSYQYFGNDAEDTWAGSYGGTLALQGTGTSPAVGVTAYGTDDESTGPQFDSTTGKYYGLPGQSVLDANDFFIVYVGRVGDATSTTGNLLDDYNGGTRGISLRNNNGSFSILLQGSVSSATLTHTPVVYSTVHEYVNCILTVFGDRSDASTTGSMLTYNGQSSAGADISGLGLLDGDGTTGFSIGRSDLGGLPAYVAVYRRSAWFAGGSTGVVDAQDMHHELKCRWTGLWPSYAAGTYAPVYGSPISLKPGASETYNRFTDESTLHLVGHAMPQVGSVKVVSQDPPGAAITHIPLNEATALDIGTMGPNTTQGIWVRRRVTEGAYEYAGDVSILRVKATDEP